MDVKEYRRRYEAELAAASPEHPASFAGSPEAATRHAAQLGLVSGSPPGESIPALLATVRNPKETVLARDAALQALGAATFLGEDFAPYRVEFLDTMRQLAKPDTASQLREKAVAVLAAEKDPDIQGMLQRGLRDPQSALVSAGKALQLLTLDYHADVAGLAEEVFHKTDDVATKEAALRVLATNANSQDLLAKVLGDKSQPRALRALSATGLHSVNPQRFAGIARNIFMDGSDYEDIRATTLGALASAPEYQALRSDSTFLDQVRQLGAQTSLKNLRAAANRLMSNQ